jgi:hypothetical protein
MRDYQIENLKKGYKRWREMNANFFVETDNWATCFSEEELDSIIKVSEILDRHEDYILSKLEKEGVTP